MSLRGNSSNFILQYISGGFTSITPTILKKAGAKFFFDLMYYTGANLFIGFIALSTSITLLFKNKRIGLLYLEMMLTICGFYVYAFHVYHLEGYFNLKHWGIFFIIFISCSMALISEPNKAGQSNTALENFIIIVLVIQVARSILTLPSEMSHMYSSGKATAQYLMEHHLVKARNIAIYPSSMAASILPYLPKDTRFYFPESDIWGSYSIWSQKWKRNRFMGYDGMIAQVESRKDLNKEIEYFITSYPITLPYYKNKVRLLKNWTNCFLDEENFYIYQRR